MAAPNGPPATRELHPNPEAHPRRPLDEALPPPRRRVPHAALRLAARRRAAPPRARHPLGAGPPRHPRDPRRVRRPAAAARAQGRDDRLQPRLVGGRLRHRRGAPHALRREERDPRLAASRAGSPSASGTHLRPPRAPPRHRAHQRPGARRARRGRLRGALPRGHDHGRRPAPQVPQLALRAGRGQPGARPPGGGPLRASRRHAAAARRPSWGTSRSRSRSGSSSARARRWCASPSPTRSSPTGSHGSEVAAEAHRRVATLLGLPIPGSAPARARRSPSRTAVSARPQTQPQSSARTLLVHAQAERGPVPADDRVRRALRGPASSNQGTRCVALLARLALEGEVHRALGRADAKPRHRVHDRAQAVVAGEVVVPAVGLVAVEARQEAPPARAPAAPLSTSPASSRAFATGPLRAAGPRAPARYAPSTCMSGPAPKPVDELVAVRRREHGVERVARARLLDALGHAEQVQVVVAEHRDGRRRPGPSRSAGSPSESGPRLTRSPTNQRRSRAGSNAISSRSRSSGSRHPCRSPIA